MPGQLFTHYFLTDGIKATAEWKDSLAQPEAFAAFRDGVRQKYEALSRAAAHQRARWHGLYRADAAAQLWSANQRKTGDVNIDDRYMLTPSYTAQGDFRRLLVQRGCR